MKNSNKIKGITDVQHLHRIKQTTFQSGAGLPAQLARKA